MENENRDPYVNGFVFVLPTPIRRLSSLISSCGILSTASSLNFNRNRVELHSSAVIKMACALLKALKPSSPLCQVMFTSTKDEMLSYPQECRLAGGHHRTQMLDSVHFSSEK